MSLNGLDSPAVQQVYNAAVNEVGGWFFLKYISRDEVELLDHGAGGVSEARSSVAQYEDLSPLYGLIMYRRKKVLIKYVPEGTSRLLQARTTVHLQDVLEKYSPYDAMVEVTSADSLSDTTLAAAFPLHTAAPSIKANMLDEITEDGEEPYSSSKSVETAPVRPLPSRMASSEKWPSRRPQSVAPQVSVDVGKSPVLSQRASVSRFLVRDESGHHSVTSLDTPPASSIAPVEPAQFANDTESVYSNKSGHSLARQKSPSVLSDNGDVDFERYYAELYKPKVRLGPRPVTLSDKSRRPNRSSSPAFSRPVSTMPAGMHIKSNTGGAPHTKLPDSASSTPPLASLPSFPPPPAVPYDSLHSPRPDSRGSSRSIPSSVKTSKSTMTPEKMRLMKAMEMRKKQMRNSTPAEPLGMTTVPEHPPVLPQQYRTLEELSETKISKADSGIQMGHESVILHSPRMESTVQREEDQKLESVPEPAAEVVMLDHATQKSSRVSGLSIDAPVAQRETPRKFDPFAVDSPTLGRTPDPQGTLPRSPALSSLLGCSKFAPFPQDMSLTRADESDDSHNTPEFDVDEKDAFLQKKRRGWVEPLTINIEHTPGPEHEHNYLSDEDFMEELQSATFQEAKPVSMQRSPASPFFPRRRISGRSAQSSRSITSALSGTSLISIINSKGLVKPMSSGDTEKTPTATPAGFLVPESQSDPDSRPPSVSSARTLDSDQGDPIGASRRANVSSGISKRIQALAEKSTREGSPPLSSSPPQPLTEKPSFVKMRKSSLQNSTEPRATVKAPANKLSVWPAPTIMPMTAPNVTISQSTKRDSVSVTARIVRHAGTQNKGPSSPTELHHSPLLINHSRKAPNHEFPPMAPLLTDNGTKEAAEDESILDQQDRPLSPTFSYSSVDSGGTDRRKSFDRKSFTSRYRSGYDSPHKSLSKHTSTTSLASEGTESEKGSRTSRFFKRISHMGGGRRKSITQVPGAQLAVPTAKAPTLASEKQSSARKDSIPDIPPPIVVGDVNVQFPDTLLWKRRWAEVDSNGNLIFTATRPGSNVTKSKTGRGFVTKFHLSELLAPYIPELDRQEMPHTVLFDLADGATLSCASEDSMAQRQLLSLLRTYHQAWTAVA